MGASDLDPVALQALFHQLGVQTKKSRRLKNPGYAGMRIHCGKQNNFYNNTTPSTLESTMVADQHFDSVRVVLSVSKASGDIASCTVSGSVAVIPTFDLTGAAQDAATYVPLTWNGGSTTGVLNAAAGTLRRTFLFSDKVDLSSMARTDVPGALPALVMRIFHATAGQITALGDGTDTLSVWRNHPTHPMFLRKGPGDFATANQSGFTASGPVLVGTVTTIAGFVFYSRGRVVNVVVSGDSLTEGLKGTYLGEGAAGKACFAMSSLNAVAYAFSNLGWSGSSSANFPVFLNDLLSVMPADVRADLAIFPNGSTNDLSGGQILAGNVDGWRKNTTKCLNVCGQFGVQPLIWPFLPSNFAAKPYGTTDQFRRNYQTELMGRTAGGLYVFDPTAVVGGPIDANGQQTLLPQYVAPDNVHLVDAGYSALASLYQGQIGSFSLN